MTRFCYTCSRYYVIAVNLIVTSLALFLLYISLSAFDKDFGLDSLDDSHPRVVHTYIAIIGAGTGIVIALLSLMGFFGAVKRSRVALTLYCAIVIIVVSFLIISLVFTYRLSSQQRPQNAKLDRDSINKTISAYEFANDVDIATRAWDKIQTELKCCGLSGPEDWTTYTKNQMIPKSCCRTHLESSLPRFEYCSSSDYKRGCWEAGSEYFYTHMGEIRIFIYLLLVFNLSCVITSLWVVRTIKRSVEIV